MEEIWKDIIGFEGIYEVSNFGRVRRIKTGRILRTSKSGGCRGYVGINLSKDGKAYGKLVHRLVAESFLPNIEGLPEVNHKDEDKTNNRVENLEWCDHKYNINYGTKIEKTRKKRLENGTYSGLSLNERRRKYYRENKDYRDKLKEAGKIYYQEHKEECKEYSMIWRKEHKEKCRLYSKKYYEKNKDEKKEKMKEYNEKNNEKIREYRRAYYYRHREEILKKMKKK
jgi:hypothetical protein